MVIRVSCYTIGSNSNLLLLLSLEKFIQFSEFIKFNDKMATEEYDKGNYFRSTIYLVVLPITIVAIIIHIVWFIFLLK